MKKTGKIWVALITALSLDHANECVGRHEDHQHLIEDRFVH